VALEVFGETATAADPGEGALDDPALGQNDEAVPLLRFTISSFQVPDLATAVAVFAA